MVGRECVSTWELSAGLLQSLFALLVAYWILSGLPRIERAMGSGKLLLWSCCATIAVNVVFLLLDRGQGGLMWVASPQDVLYRNIDSDYGFCFWMCHGFVLFVKLWSAGNESRVVLCIQKWIQNPNQFQHPNEVPTMYPRNSAMLFWGSLLWYWIFSIKPGCWDCRRMELDVRLHPSE